MTECLFLQKQAFGVYIPCFRRYIINLIYNIIIVATLKNISTEHVSTIVVISGDAISAGSSFKTLANNGKQHPINFASITVSIKVNPKVNASIGF